MPEEVASQAWDNWEPFGNYMYERKAAPRIPQQVNMDLIRHYMQEGLEPGEAYQAAMMEAQDNAPPRSDVVTRAHTLSEVSDGTISNEFKDIIIDAVRKIYNIWVENRDSNEVITDIASFLRSILGCALTTASIRGLGQFEKNAYLYGHFHRMILLYLKLENFVGFPRVVHNYWSSVLNGRETDQVNFSYPWTLAGYQEKPVRQQVADASTFLIDYALFGPAAFGIASEPPELADLAMSMRVYQCFEQQTDEYSYCQSMLAMYRQLLAIRVIQGAIPAEALQSVESFNAQTEVASIANILKYNRSLEELWELGTMRFTEKALMPPLRFINFQLTPLPTSFGEMVQVHYKRENPICQKRPQNPAVCLICGAIVCRLSDCCKKGNVGGCTSHAYECGLCQGVFIDVNSGEFFMISENRASPYDSAYLNSYRESRGRSTRDVDLEYNLDMDRYNEVRDMFLDHAIVGRIISQKTSGATIIFRDNVL